jgi:hypothetical protein
MERLVSYKTVYNTEAGKEMLKDIEKMFFMFTTTLDPNPYKSAFNEGKRAAMLDIKHLMERPESGK